LKKRVLLDQSLTPEGGVLTLHEHDGAYDIQLNASPLMSTRQHSSEEKLAELACEPLKSKARARVLIGGLGFGFTLKAALAALPADATVIVAELLEAVVAWNRNPAYPLASEALADPRVTVKQSDVAEVIRSAPGSFDAVILDVDNGPAAFSAPGNGKLYQDSGLRLTRSALRPGGCAAYWSAGPNATFEKLLGRAGFNVEVQRCRAHGQSGSWHTLFLARSQR